MNETFIKNMSRYSITYVLRYVIGFIVTTKLINYLTVNEYGIYSYIISIGTLFASFCGLGFNSIIPTFLKKNKNSKEITLVNAITASIGISLISWLIFILFTLFTSKELTYLAIIFGITFPLSASNVIKYYFEYKAELKYVTIINNITIIISNSLRIIFIFFEFEIDSFLTILVIEQAIIFLGLFFLFKRELIFLRIENLNKKTMGNLISQGIPFLFSGMMITFYMKIDQVMLKYLVNNEAVGTYSSIIRLVEAFYFIPVIIQTTYFPFILESLESKIGLTTKMIKQYLLVSIIIVPIALFIYVFSKQILTFLYSNEISNSYILLKYYSLVLVFVAIGVIRNHIIYSFQLSRFYLMHTTLGAIINIVLNLILIPKLGLEGCVIATIISQFYVSILSSLFHKQLRHNIYSYFKFSFKS